MKKSIPKKISSKNLIIFLVSLCIGIYSQYFSPSKISVPIQSKQEPVSIGTSSAILYPITRVVDGDTIKIRIGEKEDTVRLLGVDTPELVDPRKPVQCFAKEASEETKKLLDGKSVTLETDPTQAIRDKYSRLLAYVRLPDGTNVSEYLIRQGFAHEYTYDSKPHRYQQLFLDAQKEAREQKRGLWAEGVCL